jgi:hypothetical protein
VIWTLGHWDLFGIWNLGFGYCNCQEEEIGETFIDEQGKKVSEI